MPFDGLVLIAALLSGLIGSFHCVAMCGGIATGFSAMSSTPGRGWLLALQVNLGRVMGYTAAGVLVGGIGGGLLKVFRADALMVGVRMAVGVMLIIIALRLLDRRGRLGFLAGPTARVWRVLQPLQRRLLPADTAWRRFLLGMLWGWLPCGLSMNMLMAAWLQANVRDAALTMAVFGLGTLPVMVPLTWSGVQIGRWLQHPSLRMVLAIVILLAGLLTIAAPWLMHVPGLHQVLTALGCRTVPG
ncbi:MAG: sulfite exporter TauE/SafE family protein [Xanthomonadaceae bacterium]|jgi:sulfite exporter TauE/SafE|nr:sulfite exporter TauE/SafE family protein [Xanthomonadaceae bacterium]